MWIILIETPEGPAEIVAKKFVGTDQVIAIEGIMWSDCKNINKDVHFGASRLVVPYQKVYSMTRREEKKEESK